MVFQCINIRQVPWEVLKTAASGLGFQHLTRDLANVNAWKTMFDPYIETKRLSSQSANCLYSTIQSHYITIQYSNIVQCNLFVLLTKVPRWTVDNKKIKL